MLPGTFKRAKTAKWVILKGDVSLGALVFMVMRENQVVLDFSMSGYLKEPIRHHGDFKRAVRNVQKGKNRKNGDFQRKQ